MEATEKKKSYFKILKHTFKSFDNDNALKLSASLSYYTIFAIGPLLLIVITLTGLFVTRGQVVDLMNGQIRTLVGNEAALQITDIITSLQKQQHKALLFSILGGITLFMGATGVFLEIQDSINYIWCLKAKPKKGWLRFITNRLLSFSLIVGFGFLLIVSLVVNTLTDALMVRLARFFGESEAILFKGLNMIILFAVITLLFSIIYKVLPDAKIKWRDTIVGAAFTGVLFLLGKFLIGFYIGNSAIGTTYGAAASVIIILLWVYYSSIILYFGAEFTKEYAMSRGSGISPNSTAVLIEKREVKELKGKTHAGPDDIPVEHIKSA